MSKNNRQLPKPPKTPFGRNKRFEQNKGNPPLLADAMAMAEAAGKLEEFIQREIPDNDQARKLAEMMMGMTGMMPSGELSMGHNDHKRRPAQKNEDVTLSDDIMKSVMSGNTDDVIQLLKREYKKRNPDSKGTDSRNDPIASSHGLSPQEQEVLLELNEIAAVNNVSIDWLVLRALKVYVLEYQKSGKL